MARIDKRLFFGTASTTPATVYTNSAGQTTTLRSLTMAQAAAALTTNVRLSIGADGATTRVIEYVIPAGAGTYVVYPGISLTSTETLQLSSTATNNVVVCTGNGTVDLSA